MLAQEDFHRRGAEALRQEDERKIEKRIKRIKKLPFRFFLLHLSSAPLRLGGKNSFLLYHPRGRASVRSLASLRDDGDLGFSGSCPHSGQKRGKRERSLSLVRMPIPFSNSVAAMDCAGLTYRCLSSATTQISISAWMRPRRPSS